MELRIKPFDGLDREELFQILRARMAVFVEEQRCPYQDFDDIDLTARHAALWDGGALLAYLRLFRRDARTGQLGRLLALRRRQGLGTAILRAGVEALWREPGVERIYLEAQCYAAPLYEKEGFRRVSGEFLEDGIPHVAMLLERGDGCGAVYSV